MARSIQTLDLARNHNIHVVVVEGDFLPLLHNDDVAHLLVRVQTYHEEMLQRSPRRKVFNDYAKQLMRRYPSMKDEIQIRLQHLNGQWEALEKVISAGGATRDEQTMLRGMYCLMP